MTRYPSCGSPSLSLPGTVACSPAGTAPAGVRLRFAARSRPRLCSLQRFVWEGWPVRVMTSLLCAWSSVSSSVLVQSA